MFSASRKAALAQRILEERIVDIGFDRPQKRVIDHELAIQRGFKTWPIAETVGIAFKRHHEPFEAVEPNARSLDVVRQADEAKPDRPQAAMSTGPFALRPRRGSTSRQALANSNSGSGRTSILSGRAINQTSFLNIYCGKASFEQEVVHVAVANVDGLRSLRKKAPPEGKVAFNILSLLYLGALRPLMRDALLPLATRRLLRSRGPRQFAGPSVSWPASGGLFSDGQRRHFLARLDRTP
jgi:hypothetical protein